MDSIIFTVITFFTFGIAIYSFVKVFTTYNKYKKIDNKSSLSGCEVALKILSNNGLDNVYVVEVKGFLEDHYDINRNVIRLSTHTFHEASMISLALAAKESAYAIKGKNKSLLLKIKGLLLPTVTIITYLGYIGLLLALASTSFLYIKMAISVMFFVELFHLIMFKLDIDAMKRGNLELKKLQLVKKSELEDLTIVSNAMRYLSLASLITCIISLLSKLLKK